jgi:hypothetical protein
MAPWLQFLEAWAVQQLLRTPAFHRAVEKIARRVHRARHNLPPDAPSGTDLPQPSDGFMKHFLNEIKAQVGNKEGEEIAAAARKTTPSKPVLTKEVEETNSAEAVWRMAQRGSSAVKKEAGAQKNGDAAHATAAKTQEDVDAAWREALRNGPPVEPKGSFVGEYWSALREQMGRGTRGK